MDINKILRALESAQYLIESEYQSLCDDGLELEYQDILDEISEAIAEIKNARKGIYHSPASSKSEG